MAANINFHQPRAEHALTERDESSNGEPATPEGSSAQPTESSITAPTEQQGQSGDGGGSDAGTHDPANPPPPPIEVEAATPFPAEFRYGLGEVSIGRPEYARFNANEADPLREDQGKPSPREAAPATTTAALTAKPIPMLKPGGTIAPDASVSLPASTTSISSTITNAPSISGEAVLAQPPSNRIPYLTAGLHTQPEQSPHYANALAYGREHGYNDDEVMKLAVLMQANRDNDQGLAWLDLKPEVLRAAVNAVVRNPDNSFDTSGVFGGRLGCPRVNSQRIPADAATAPHGYLGDGAPQYASAPPEGWVLIEETVASPGGGGDSGDSATTTLRYYVPQNEINVVDEAAYLALAVAGYMQVPRGYESELSVGADGGVHDLGALSFDLEFGLVMRTDNYRPYDPDDNDWDRFMEIVTIGTISIGTMAIIGPTIAAGLGSSTAGVVATGAVKGVVGSAITTMLQGGEVTFRGLLQAAFSGGMIAGLNTLESYQALDNLGRDATGATHFALRAMSITGTSTIRGAIQELIGGRFRDGFTQGIMQGLSSELTSYLNAEIAAGVAQEQITPAQANALRELTRFTGSALRAAANPNDPMNAFAQDYLGQLFGPPEATTNTNGGNSKPVDTETQQEMIWMQDAIDSGYTDTAAVHFNNIMERRAAANPNASRTDIANQLMLELGIKPDTLGFVVGANGNVTVTERVDRPTAITRLAAAYQRFDPSLTPDAARALANDYINRRGIPATFAEMMIPDIVVRPGKPEPFSTGSQIVDQIIGGVQGAVMTGYNYVSGILKGVVDIGRIPFDGVLDIVNRVINENVFADSAQRNAARVDMFNNIVANLDQLPAQVAQYFNGRLERANQMDAAGDYIGAARERTELIGDLISMITNPRAPGATRILERLGVDPATFQRSTQTQRAFREAAIAQEIRINPRFANVDTTLYQAHHTIPIREFPQLAEFRTRLQNWGIDINAMDNAVMLPGPNLMGPNSPGTGTYHGLLGSAAYARTLDARFQGVNTAADARQVLAAINNELRNGTFRFVNDGK
jgi:A nuclease family of the HNH/ENDO VII superfamily with conserved AHH